MGKPTHLRRDASVAAAPRGRVAQKRCNLWALPNKSRPCQFCSQFRSLGDSPIYRGGRKRPRATNGMHKRLNQALSLNDPPAIGSVLPRPLI